MTSKKLSAKDRDTLLTTLQARFEANMARHKGVAWGDVVAKLEAKPEALWSLHQMEASGGEPDVVVVDKKASALTFFDCAAESPKDRRSFCYDRKALDSRKANKPANNAVAAAAAMGTQLLTVEQYQGLQKLGDYDLKTSSWVETPSDVRDLGGALFGDKRFGRTFIYHNGAESYYAARAFRTCLTV